MKAPEKQIRRMWILLLFLLLGITIAQLYVHHQALHRVGFQFDCWGIVDPPGPKWHGKWLWTRDEAFLRKVEDWRRGLQRPVSENAFRQGGGRIMLEFNNGRREEYLFVGAN